MNGRGGTGSGWCRKRGTGRGVTGRGVSGRGWWRKRVVRGAGTDRAEVGCQG